MRYACVILSLNVLWWDEAVKVTLKGPKNMHLRLVGGPAPARHLLTDDLIRKVVGVAVARGARAFQWHEDMRM